jgi:hypothetical protein
VQQIFNMRRGACNAGAEAANASPGRIASSSGRARATPVAVKKVRRSICLFIEMFIALF